MEKKIKNQQRTHKDAGYSLLEIMVVLVIMGLLATLVAPRLFGQVDKSRVTTAKAQAKSLRLALDSYRLDVGRYPTQQEGLTALITAPQGNNGSWFGPYLDGEMPRDPWGNSYIYEAPATNENGQVLSPKVISLGADNTVGGNGNDADISS